MMRRKCAVVACAVTALAGVQSDCFAQNAERAALADIAQRTKDRLERCAFFVMFDSIASRSDVPTTQGTIENICRNEIEAYNSAKQDEFAGRRAPISLEKTTKPRVDHANGLIGVLMKLYESKL